MIIFLKHTPSEGPGSLGRYLKSMGLEYKILDLSCGDEVPESTDGISAVICLGGPMNVYEEIEFPFLKAENIFIRQIIGYEVPFLGICLGAQLLAKAAGARVFPAQQKETGWYRTDITEHGRSDEIFKNIAGPIDVFQWHGDTFEMPQNGVLLAQGLPVTNQAFRIDRNAYGFQFHVETDKAMLIEWFKGTTELEEYLGTFDKIEYSYGNTAETIFSNFCGLIHQFKNYSGRKGRMALQK